MVQLVLVFCLAVSANTCKEVRPLFEDELTLMGCLTRAQFVATNELAERLDLQRYRLARWRCEVAGPGRRRREFATAIRFPNIQRYRHRVATAASGPCVRVPA